MPLRDVVAQGSEDNCLSRMAQIYRNMGEEEYFQARDDYYAFHPEANHKSWRQYLEDLADEEYDEIREAEIAAGSRGGRTYSLSGPRRADHSGPCISASLSDGEDFSYDQGRRDNEGRHHDEEDLADQLGYIYVGGRPSQHGAGPLEYGARVSCQSNLSDEEHWPDESEDVYSDRRGARVDRSHKYGEFSTFETHLDRLSDGDSCTVRGQDYVRQQRRPGHANKSRLDGFFGDEFDPSAREQRGKTATTRYPDSTDTSLPPASPFDIDIRRSSSQNRPQPPSQPDRGQCCLKGGRYNAGVRALRSPDTSRPSIQANDGQGHPSKGRYNMGVRAPRSPSQAKDGQAHTSKGRYDMGVRVPHS